MEVKLGTFLRSDTNENLENIVISEGKNYHDASKSEFLSEIYIMSEEPFAIA